MPRGAAVLAARVGHRLRVPSTTDANRGVVCGVTGSASDAVDYVDVPLAFDSANESLLNNSPVRVELSKHQLRLATASGGPAAG